METVRHFEQKPRLVHSIRVVRLADPQSLSSTGRVSADPMNARRRMGARLRYLRASVRGYSAQKLAELLFIHFGYRIDSTTLTKIETADSRPNTDLLFLLCELYEVDLNTLVDFEPVDTAVSPRRMLTDPDLTGELQRLIELGGRQTATRILKDITRALNELLNDKPKRPTARRLRHGSQ